MVHTRNTEFTDYVGIATSAVSVTLEHAAFICFAINQFLVPGSSRQGVGTVHASSNFAASDYMSHR